MKSFCPSLSLFINHTSLQLFIKVARHSKYSYITIVKILQVMCLQSAQTTGTDSINCGDGSNPSCFVDSLLTNFYVHTRK